MIRRASTRSHPTRRSSSRARPTLHAAKAAQATSASPGTRGRCARRANRASSTGWARARPRAKTSRPRGLSRFSAFSASSSCGSSSTSSRPDRTPPHPTHMHTWPHTNSRSDHPPPLSLSLAHVATHAHPICARHRPVPDRITQQCRLPPVGRQCYGVVSEYIAPLMCVRTLVRIGSNRSTSGSGVSRIGRSSSARPGRALVSAVWSTALD